MFVLYYFMTSHVKLSDNANNADNSVVVLKGLKWNVSFFADSVLIYTVAYDIRDQFSSYSVSYNKYANSWNIVLSNIQILNVNNYLYTPTQGIDGRIKLIRILKKEEMGAWIE